MVWSICVPIPTFYMKPSLHLCGFCPPPSTSFKKQIDFNGMSRTQSHVSPNDLLWLFYFILLCCSLLRVMEKGVLVQWTLILECPIFTLQLYIRQLSRSWKDMIKLYFISLGESWRLLGMLMGNHLWLNISLQFWLWMHLASNEGFKHFVYPILAA